MNFELTISGLCVIVLKAKEAKPEHPTAVDIIIPQACHHAGRLTYLPSPVKHVRKVQPKLVIDEAAGRIASLDINQAALQLTFGTNPNTKFDVHWGAYGQTPSAPWEETCLEWLPRLEELGFEPFRVGPPGTLPTGASARLTLPPGKLATRQIIKNPDTNQYLRWKFPAVNVRKALANEIIYTVDGADNMNIVDSSGAQTLYSKEKGIRPVRMCITNDLEYVPYNYGGSSAALEHLRHVDSMASGTFQKPIEVNDERTGHPICMSVIFVNHGSERKRRAPKP